ncbi:MAG: hypothetical protein AAFR58_03285 [Cyanobacteria bacterium J06627_28]
MDIVSIRVSLLTCLNLLLFGKYEDKGASFISFLYKDATLTNHVVSPWEIAGLSHRNDWRKIPLQPSCRSRCRAESRIDRQADCQTAALRYVCALPQVLSQHPIRGRYLSIPECTERTIIFLQKTQRIWLSTQDKYRKELPPSLFNLWHEFKIESLPDGKIEFELSSAGLCHWLRHVQTVDLSVEKNCDLANNQLSSQLTQKGVLPLIPKSRELPQKTSNNQVQINQLLWRLQYTYGRCISFLSSAYLWVDEIIDVDETIDDDIDGGDGTTARQAIRDGLPMVLSKAVEADLKASIEANVEVSAIALELVETVDAMVWIPYRSPSRQYLRLLKRGERLCRAFDRFQRRYMVGCAVSAGMKGRRVSVKRPERYQECLSLTLATKIVLQSLLEQYLGAIAPSSL